MIDFDHGGGVAIGLSSRSEERLDESAAKRHEAVITLVCRIRLLAGGQMRLTSVGLSPQYEQYYYVLVLIKIGQLRRIYYSICE
jgi:hypothetical protein